LMGMKLETANMHLGQGDINNTFNHYEVVELEKQSSLNFDHDNAISFNSEVTVGRFKEVCEYLNSKRNELGTSAYEKFLSTYYVRLRRDTLVSFRKFFVSWSYLPYFDFTCDISDACVVTGITQKVIMCSDGFVVECTFQESAHRYEKVLVPVLGQKLNLSERVFFTYGRAKVVGEKLLFTPHSSNFFHTFQCQKGLSISKGAVVNMGCTIDLYVHGTVCNTENSVLQKLKSLFN